MGEGVVRDFLQIRGGRSECEETRREGAIDRVVPNVERVLSRGWITALVERERLIDVREGIELERPAGDAGVHQHAPTSARQHQPRKRIAHGLVRSPDVENDGNGAHPLSAPQGVHPGEAGGERASRQPKVAPGCRGHGRCCRNHPDVIVGTGRDPVDGGHPRRVDHLPGRASLVAQDAVVLLDRDRRFGSNGEVGDARWQNTIADEHGDHISLVHRTPFGAVIEVPRADDERFLLPVSLEGEPSQHERKAFTQRLVVCSRGNVHHLRGRQCLAIGIDGARDRLEGCNDRSVAARQCVRIDVVVGDDLVAPGSAGVDGVIGSFHRVRPLVALRVRRVAVFRHILVGVLAPIDG